jgi:hypothetical protein
MSRLGKLLLLSTALAQYAFAQQADPSPLGVLIKRHID